MSEGAPDAATLRWLRSSRRLEAFATAPAWGVLAPIPSVLLFLVILARHPGAEILVPWAVATLAAVGLRIVAGRRVRSNAPDIADLAHQWRAANLTMMAASLAWAAGLPLAAWVYPGAVHPVAIVGAVHFGGVLLWHRAAPAAASFHIVVTAAALILAEWLAFGWSAWPLLALVAVYGLGLLAAVRLHERQFRALCLAELARTESERTIRGLLNDHEAQAADWLWTVDADGALRDVSERFADFLGSAPHPLEGQDFVSLFEPGRERERLARLIGEGTPFRDEPLPIAVDGTRRWWRLSGRPRADGGMSGVGRDASDQDRIEQRVRTMAHVDPLTGLANRHRFNQRLRELLGDGGAHEPPPALLFVDLDDFKAVNDTHGHLFGDSLLREMGARLRGESGEGELVARLGGDEFAVLVEAPGGDGMLIERAHRLLAAVREPFRIDGQSVRVSSSVGVARAARDSDPAGLMRRVELALHAAKAKGRDQMAIFDQTLDRRARERRTLELQLREAVAREELVLHYQPIIALQSGATVGYEALVRWRHPQRGLLLPDQFLALAEETGLMIGLGDWVIRQALAEVGEWRGDFRIALNLSPSQIRNPRLIATIDGALAASGIAPDRLELEITEHVLIEDAAAGSQMIKRLRALGAEIALDDFGTGYSSLSYLRRYRFDRVKIDRTFVRDIETSVESQAIVSAITRLAQALGMSTTAEGVERPGQLDLLRKLGCDEAQGFLILEPVEAQRIEQARIRGEDLPEVAQEIEDYREARRAVLAEVAPRRGV